MMGKKFMFLIVSISLLLGSCINDDGANFHFTTLRIVDAEVPESFDLNKTYQINITYSLPDGCTSYEGFDISKTAITTRNVVAIGAVRTDAEACIQSVVEGTASFNFKVIYNEPYTFNFYQGENSDGEAEFLEFIVPVN